MKHLPQYKTFRDLSVGDEFDFIDDANPTWNSFYDRCLKTSARKYIPVEGKLQGLSLRVESINCAVYHLTD